MRLIRTGMLGSLGINSSCCDRCLLVCFHIWVYCHIGHFRFTQKQHVFLVQTPANNIKAVRVNYQSSEFLVPIFPSKIPTYCLKSFSFLQSFTLGSLRHLQRSYFISVTPTLRQHSTPQRRGSLLMRSCIANPNLPMSLFSICVDGRMNYAATPKMRGYSGRHNNGMS